MTPRAPQARITFSDALTQLEGVLLDDSRAAMIDAFSAPGRDAPVARLRAAMRSHSFPGAGGILTLRRLVDILDARTRKEGMHVLQGWDFVAHRFPTDIAPILLLDYCARTGIPAERERAALAILLDQYFLALLSLLAVRAWDEDDPNENLDRLSAVVRQLHVPHGSGYPCVADAETLLMLAVSYYHPEERGYDLLVSRVASLDVAHQRRFARPCAALLGSHLRWGMRFMYQRDVGRMRADNVADYPLLALAVTTLAREYDALRAAGADGAGREAVVGSLLDGLSADPWAFAGGSAPGLPDWKPEATDIVATYRDDLMAEFGRHQPSPRAYSPLAFSCNFPANATVAMAVLAVHNAIPFLPLNALFVREQDGVPAERSSRWLAQALMQFAASDPARLGAGGSPLIVYDPFDGAHCFNTTLRTLGAAR